MPNNKKKQMSFGSSKKATNKVKKTKADATLMETKTLPRAQKNHSNDKDKEEKNLRAYELSVEQSSRSKLYVKAITKKVKFDNPCTIFMAEAAVDNQFKLDQEKVKCIGDDCKTSLILPKFKKQNRKTYCFRFSNFFGKQIRQQSFELHPQLFPSYTLYVSVYSFLRCDV